MRFRLIATATGQILGDFQSVYEPLQKTNPRATELASHVSVYWSPDSRHLVLDEAFDGETSSGLVVIVVTPTAAKKLSLPLERLASFLSKKYHCVTVEFHRWLGKRMFYATIHGETDHQDADNEYESVSLVIKVEKDDTITTFNPDE